jgi:two-component SAPR family response regulator
MITAYAERLGNSDNPVDAILNKPVEFEELRRAMARLLSRAAPARSAQEDIW